MKHRSKQPEGQRQLRVGEEIRHVISTALQHGGFSSPALMNSSLITVTQVKISPDLKNATVFVMPLGGHNLEEILFALNAQAYAFQREIAHKMKIRFTPKLVFKSDETFGEAEKIDRILKQIHDEE
jgi:ribosome-binding factor A